MSAYYNIPGSTKTPQGVIIVDPVTGQTSSALRAFDETINQAVTTTSASVALPEDTAEMHLSVVGCHARIRFGIGTQVAVGTDARIMNGVPYDLAIPAGATHLGVIAESGSGTLAGTKLV